MALFDPVLRGRYIKLSRAWEKLDDITDSKFSRDAQGDLLTIKRKGKADLIYRGKELPRVREVLKKEGKEK